MIRNFRSSYLGRSLREKILLVGLALIAIAMWLAHFGGQVADFWRAAHATSRQLAAQQQLLDNRAAIFASAEQAASKFDPARTLNGIALTTAATDLAANAGLNNTHADEEPDVSNGQFAVHTLHFEIPKADWPALLSFAEALQKQHPYISIENFQILADKVGDTHTANMVLSSVEIERAGP
jgi:hypothetical protein